MKEEDKLEFAGVLFTPDRVMQIQDNRPETILDQNDIQNITIRYGFKTSSPWRERLAGIVAILISLIILYHFITFFTRGGMIWLGEAFTLALGIIGVWFIISSFKKGYFLELKTKKNRMHKFSFESNATFSQIQAFLSEVNSKYGYNIRYSEYLLGEHSA